MLDPASSIFRLTPMATRSLSAENPDGAPGGGGRAEIPDPPQLGQPSGHARELGRGWKVRPRIQIQPGATATLGDVAGPGLIQSIWMTPASVASRDLILRFYWDGQEHPSVETPLGDFFAAPYVTPTNFAPLVSSMVCVNPGSAFNAYWPMPFLKHCRVTLENRNPDETLTLYYQINYALTDVPDDAGYFHAQFRRSNPLPDRRVHVLLDGVLGPGRYVGTSLAWQSNHRRWWGEGEVKFYLDGDIPETSATEDAVAEHGGDCFPTICGTGTEDYFCGSYNFENKATRRYETFITPYAGLAQICRPDGLYESQTRFAMYRWHLPDPVCFRERIAVTIQALGWRSGQRYLPLRDDLASTAFWYQRLPSEPFPALGDRDHLELT